LTIRIFDNAIKLDGWFYWTLLIKKKIMRSGDLTTLFCLPHPNSGNNLISVISMSFTEVYGDLFLPFVESYKAAKNEKNRALVVKNAADAVLESRHLLEDQDVDLPKDLKTVRLFHYVSFFTVTHQFRPSLGILKAILRRKQLRRVGIPNLQNSSKFTPSEI
jgi:hypothetical protein